MKSLKQLFDFYLDSSIHVAFSCFALVNCTYIFLNIFPNYGVSLFAFFGTIVGYNFVKFDALVRTKKEHLGFKLKAIISISLLAFIGGFYYFLELQKITKIIALVVLILTILYALPIYPNKKNARNWAGFKIYIVAICWVVVTFFLPVINSESIIDLEIVVIMIQRFILVFTLILLFELKDLKNDEPHLRTIPQQIGVKNTKRLGYILLFWFIGIRFLNGNLNVQYLELYLNIVIAIVIGLFLFFITEKKSKYYTDFWVESIPIVWWLLYQTSSF